QLSLFALVAVILVSCTTSVNPGLLAVVLAWVLGVYVAPLLGHEIGLKTVVAGFPTELFLTLTGVTLLFSQARANGSLDLLAGWALRGCRGRPALLPVAFFLLALGFASVGAGNIAAAALIAPPALAAAARAGIPVVLMAIVVGHGATAGTLSPIAPTGLIAGGLLEKMGLGGHGWGIYLSNLVANAVAAAGAYLLFGGLRLLRRPTASSTDPAPLPQTGPSAAPAEVCFSGRHGVTLGLILLMVVGALFLQVQVGMAAITAALLLSLFRLAEEAAAIRAVPWSTLLMVCGVTVLTALLERTGGLDLFTDWTARTATRETISGVIAFVTGLLSVYSSTSGVVLPALLPGVPGLVQKLGGADPIAIAFSINVGGHLVDVSPLSTIGALCVAAAPEGEDRRRLFNRMLLWGLSMAAAGGVYCWLVFRPAP
ncbi:MAG: hypothetical protein FJX77_10280, partial [Armatimonadetes bacterium]|nr:hypothetical protein [Armatimonadota bacterium]